MGRRLLILVCLFTLFSLPAFAGSKWAEVRSQHFRVLTNAGAGRGHDIARHFEEMRGVFAVLFHRSSLNQPAPLDIVAFRSQDEFMRYVPHANGKPVSLSGFVQRGTDRNYAGIDASSANPFHDLAGEYAKLLLRNNFPVTPPWFEEGFARFFSTVQVDKEKVQYGTAPNGYVSLLNGSKWIPISAVFGVQQGSDAGNSGPMFAAESWLAMQYIMTKDLLPQAFQYLHLSQIEGVPVPQAIQQAFGVNAAGFEKNLRDHLASLAPATMPLPDLNDEPYNAASIDTPDAQAVLADMHAHSSDHSQQALAELQALLKAHPTNEIANRAIGYWYLTNGHLAEAKLALRKAVAAEDNDANAHYLLGLTFWRQGEKDGTTPTLLLQVEQQAQLATQLDPQLADAEDLLAFGLAGSRRYDQALQAEMRAISLAPSVENYQLNLAHIYAQAGRWSDAQAVLRRLETSGDPGVRDKATQRLASLNAERQQFAEKQRIAAMGITDPTAPQWRMTQTIKAEDEEDAKEDAEKYDTRKSQYFTGVLESVDCSHPPAAIVKVRKGSHVMHLRTDNYKNLIVVGTDAFSCGWRNKKVLINYKAGGKSDGDLVTLEVEGK